jgi:hypothetical protein
MENQALEKINVFGEITPQQRAAIDIKALKPSISYSDIARELDLHHATVQKWFKQPKVIDAAYDRFMEVAGNRLVTVLDAMIREAEQGSVPAATLVLKHWGKLQDTIHVRIESPFEKFLKLEDVDYEVVESNGDITDVVADLPITETLPDRNPKNDKPHARVYRQSQRLRHSVKDARRKARRHIAYSWRKRAEAVGLTPLPPGRPPDHVKRKWRKELEKMERSAGIPKENA